MQRCDLVVGEGATEIAIAKRILQSCAVPHDGAPLIDKGGANRFWLDVGKYAAAAQSGLSVFGLADLENAPCAEWLFTQHLPRGRPSAFTLRLAVRMAESWLLADTSAVARWLCISATLIPAQPDLEPHAKLTLVNLARRSRKRSLREALIPPAGHSSLVGREYTPTIRSFIATRWDPHRAAERSPSLARALRAIRSA